jgi:hypothetical protein
MFYLNNLISHLFLILFLLITISLFPMKNELFASQKVNEDHLLSYNTLDPRLGGGSIIDPRLSGNTYQRNYSAPQRQWNQGYNYYTPNSYNYYPNSYYNSGYDNYNYNPFPDDNYLYPVPSTAYNPTAYSSSKSTYINAPYYYNASPSHYYPYDR